MSNDNGPREQALRQHLVSLLKGGGAHVKFDSVITGFPAKLRGHKPAGAPHTAWQLLEHMRIAQWDIVEFSKNRRHKSPDFPEGYWPKTEAPTGADEWNASVKAFRKDLKAMQDLVSALHTDLYARLPWGDGQTILRQALVLSDHNAYHLGQLVLLRRLLGAWED